MIKHLVMIAFVVMFGLYPLVFTARYVWKRLGVANEQERYIIKKCLKEAGGVSLVCNLLVGFWLISKLPDRRPVPYLVALVAFASVYMAIWVGYIFSRRFAQV
jgi:hypothetical protein